MKRNILKNAGMHISKTMCVCVCVCARVRVCVCVQHKFEFGKSGVNKLWQWMLLLLLLPSVSFILTIMARNECIGTFEEMKKVP